jgi:hypothetical protein
MEIEGLQLAIGAVLDILFIMLSNFSKVSLINVEDCILISLLGFFFFVGWVIGMLSWKDF